MCIRDRRTDSVKRRIFFVLGKKKEKLHLLKGLKRILLDIDKAIRIIRETEEEAEVIPNLMIGFGIDQIQAEYVAEIKLRNINKEYILKRTRETDALRDEIDDLEDLLNSPKRVKKVIVEELNACLLYTSSLALSTFWPAVLSTRKSTIASMRSPAALRRTSTLSAKMSARATPLRATRPAASPRWRRSLWAASTRVATAPSMLYMITPNRSRASRAWSSWTRRAMTPPPWRPWWPAVHRSLCSPAAGVHRWAIPLLLWLSLIHI